MKFKIVNLYAGFQNSYTAMPWALFIDGKLSGTFRRRAYARAYVNRMKRGEIV